jgi:acyl dehydratase
MPLDYEMLMALPPRENRQTYTRRDTVLYALGVGAGIGAAQDQDLRFIYEEGLQALPTMAVVLGNPGFWQREPEMKITWQKVLHGEQSIRLHRPLPVEGAVVSQFRIVEIYDKGADKGALLYSERKLYDDATGDLLSTISQSSFLRGDGGFGGTAVNERVPYPVPEGAAADHVELLATRPEQAMIYRLSGDYNPLHVDPQVARSVGFDGPILHGLCTYGLAGRAAVKTVCGGEPHRLKRLDVRFSSPVYPGETIEFHIWNTQPGCAALKARVVERDSLVLNNGYIEFKGD